MMYTEEDKKAIIEIIEWYRDDYHKFDCGHNDMIETIRTTNDEGEIKLIEEIIDGWVDGPPYD